MRIIRTDQLDDLDEEEKFWVYNGLDSAITREVFDCLHPGLDPETTGLIYDFERTSLGPAICMGRRGVKVDVDVMRTMAREHRERISALGGMAQDPIKRRWFVENEDAPLQQFSRAFCGKTLNYHSDKQLKKLFYEHMDLPFCWKFEKGKKRVTVDRDAIERLSKRYPRIRAIGSIILRLRDLEKDLDVLEGEVSPDGRIHFSFDVAGTETGRWASRSGLFTIRGPQGQNITEELRRIFIADDGHILVYPDLDQAESRVVAYLAEDEAYINACESGDLHTTVAQMVWPDLPWTGNLAEDKRVAEQLYYRHYSHRFMCKKAGHGSNYGGTPRTLGTQMKVEEKYIKRFQLLYFGGETDVASVKRWEFDDLLQHATVFKDGTVEVEGSFPNIRQWHSQVAQELQLTGQLTNPLGRVRKFWNRLSDDATFREGLAFLPQSSIGDINHLGLTKIWLDMDPQDAQVLIDSHDGSVMQVPEDRAHAIIPRIHEHMTIPVDVKGREMVIPVSIKTGYNWGEYDKDKNENEKGLRDWKKVDTIQIG